MISVILPVYRVEKYIRACIGSVLAQTYRDYEVILVNDGSPDSSAVLAEELLQADGSVPYQVIHTENRGVSAARNTGLAYAKGEYVIMVDSDDVISETFLQDYADLLNDHPGCDIYSTGFTVVDENDSACFPEAPVDVKELSRDRAQIEFFNRTTRFLLPTLLLRRDFLENNKIGFDEAVRYSEDVQFIWKCLAYNRKTVVHSTKQNYNYILHPGSTMTASGIPKILTCCGGISRLLDKTKELFCEDIREHLEPRLYFSLLHGAAKMLDKKCFFQLYDEAKCRPHICDQSRQGSLKVRLTATALLVSRSFGYQIMRKF